jgi:hypothetical protein
MRKETKHILIGCAVLLVLFALWKYAPRDLAASATGGAVGSVVPIFAGVFI